MLTIISTLIDINQLVNSQADRNSAIKKSHIKTVATVQKMEAYTHHYYEDIEIDFSDKESEKYGFESPDEFIKHQKRAVEQLLGKPFDISYRYSINGKNYTGNNIAMVGSRRDEKVFMKTQMDSNIAVAVNPKDHAESYIIFNSSEDFFDEKIRLSLPYVKQLSKFIFIAAAVIITFTL
jgi:hypothetical protein